MTGGALARSCAVCAAFIPVLALCGCSDVEATYAVARPVAVVYDLAAPVEVAVEPAAHPEAVEEDVQYAEEPVYEVPEEPVEYWDPEPYAEEQEYEEPEYEYGYEYMGSEWSGAVASAYSTWCNGGTATASGIPLDDCTPTVASLWLPLGSYIEVSYGDASVVCQVTDRGPYIDGRDLDLSLGTVNALGISSTDEWGVREVSYRVL